VNSIFAPDASKSAILYNARLNSAIADWIEMPITIYGIKNCDTMKKARAWLDSHGVAYDFHDYKIEGIAKDRLKRWSDELGWEMLLNRAGTTFRKLPDDDKEGLNERKALDLMLAQPSMIKRPVLDLGGKLVVGFKPEIYAKEVAPSGRPSVRKA
jgi:arsenate reductase